MLSRLERGISLLINIAAKISMVAVFGIMLLGIADALGRYIFNHPLPVSLELIEILLGIATFPAMAYVTREDANVRVDLLREHFSEKMKLFFDCITSFLSMFIIAILSWQMGVRALEMIQNPTTITPYLQISIAPFFAIAALGMCLMCLQLMVEFGHNISLFVARWRMRWSSQS